MSGHMSIQSSSVDNSDISSTFGESVIGCSEFNEKRFHITIINHKCTSMSNNHKIGNKTHKEFRIYRETLDTNPESLANDKKHLNHKIFQVQRNSIKNNQDDLIIFD